MMDVSIMNFHNPVTLPFLLGTLLVYKTNADCDTCRGHASIWEAFCREERIYTPYVRVFHKGRQGAMLRDRGPGFVDLSGLTDIYVCTNGLVMMYYAKTTAMGEVYEHGEMHWTPHHCELYNPSANSGMKKDFPGKCLLSILLIGHPQDYRLPAMQMFVAPLYDKFYGGYVNATSLIMIGGDGECLMEKGAERARLRVRLDNDKIMKDIDAENADAIKATPPRKLKNYPHMFCQLDVQRKLGQHEKGLITLKHPGDTYVPIKDKDKYPYDDPSVRAAPKGSRRETGSAISPRYRASELEAISGGSNDEMKAIADVADEVYAALLADRKIEFVGCLRYPEFNSEQTKIIMDKSEEYKDLGKNFTDDFANWTVAVHPFFNQTAHLNLKPIPDGVEGENRKKVWIDDVEIEKDFDKLKKYSDAKLDYDNEVNTTTKELEDEEDETKNPTPNKTKIAQIKNKLKLHEIKFSLWPYKAAYFVIYTYAQKLAEKLEAGWKNLTEEVWDDPAAGASSPDPLAPGEPLDQAVTEKADTLAKRKELVAKAMSHSRFARRYEPYNRRLVQEYEVLAANYSQFVSILNLVNTRLGPKISDLETLTSRYKMYTTLIKKTLQELMDAIKLVERTGNPAKPPPGGDPQSRTFVDTVIEIADARKVDDAADYTEEDPEYTQAHVCNTLPTTEDTCNGIKPNTTRANKLLKNRQGKGIDWGIDDQWRQKVLDLLEEIFKKVCPYMSESFPTAINRLVKGYLMGDPAGTGLHEPIHGSRLKIHNHKYQAIVYNQTYAETNPSNFTKPPTFSWNPLPKLRSKTPFWTHILDALEDCNSKAVPMQFWHNEEGDKPAYITYRKFFPNNNTEMHYDVEELLMQEKADQEYSFNWAIEMNWRIFATVLGSCMPLYESKIPLISSRFYALYSQDFLSPLRQIWMSNRDNPVLRVILGNFYGNCHGDKWARTCMETAFVESGDRSYRPPRYLYVNAFTEMNYFTTGPFAGSSGMLGQVGNGQAG